MQQHCVNARARKVAGWCAVLVLPVLAAGCPSGGGPGGPVNEDPPVASTTAADEVLAAHQSLIDAFEAADLDTAVALLEPSEGLVVFHPFLENRFEGRDECRLGLQRMMARLPDLQWSEVDRRIEIRNDVAWLTAQVLVKVPVLERPFVGRGTEVWVRRQGRWLLAHGHWSEHARLAGGVGDE
jgi:ketosteroid isomerase-like protein